MRKTKATATTGFAAAPVVTPEDGQSVLAAGEMSVAYNGANYPVIARAFKTIKETYQDESSYRGGDGLTLGETYRFDLIKVAGEYRELTFKRGDDATIVMDRTLETAKGYVITLPMGLHIEVTLTTPLSRASGSNSLVSYTWNYTVSAMFGGKPIPFTVTDLARLRSFARDLPSTLGASDTGLNAY